MFAEGAAASVCVCVRAEVWALRQKIPDVLHSNLPRGVQGEVSAAEGRVQGRVQDG